ncbi:hypothetical protein KAR91_02765 [Candidatus Pacearchaeota archaeon]|nr:hypothetical protein [Candidatus Pacearchaeota archaeon]
MKRINVEGFRHNTSTFQLMLGEGINEIMDYLEKNLPANNGKFYKCKGCGHITGYTGDACCAKPDYELYTG